jgi:DNA-binding response OmpR family regulator
MAQRILITEDDPNIARVVTYHLQREAWECRVAPDGEAALALIDEWAPDLVLLDVMLPKLSGLDVCQAIRRRPGRQPAVLMMSARVEELDAVLGLTAGADDYVRKPVGMVELVARCRTLLLRRGPANDERAPARRPAMVRAAPVAPPIQEPESLVRGDLVLDPIRRELRLRGEALDTTPTEFDLLYFLALRPGRVVPRDEILDRVRGYSHKGYARTIDSHVARLRRKLRHAGGADVIQTVFGIGYRFVVAEAA